MRLIISAMVIVLSIMIANEVYSISDNRVKILRDMCTATERMISYIKYGSYDVFTVCQLSMNDLEALSNRLICDNVSFEAAWENFCKNIDIPERDIFASVGEILGSFDADTQISRLENILNELRADYSSQKDKLIEKKRICYTIGCFLGVMLVILIS